MWQPWDPAEIGDDPEAEQGQVQINVILPVNRVIVSARRSCPVARASSRRLRSFRASTLRWRTGASPAGSGGRTVGLLEPREPPLAPRSPGWSFSASTILREINAVVTSHLKAATVLRFHVQRPEPDKYSDFAGSARLDSTGQGNRHRAYRFLFGPSGSPLHCRAHRDLLIASGVRRFNHPGVAVL